MHICYRFRTLILGLASLGYTNIYGLDSSKFEFGGGLAALFLPDYHGSDESRAYFLPLPYIKYTGKRLKIDDSGINGRIIQNDHFTLQLSIGAGLPVSGKKNRARKGMKPLDPVFEIGPEMIIDLYKYQNISIRLGGALRTIFTINLKRPDHVGFYHPPYLGIYHFEPIQNHKGQVSFIMGPIFASKPYNEYYYNVPNQHQTDKRKKYSSKEGFLGIRYEIGFKIRYNSHWVGGFVRNEDLSGSIVKDSPLFKTRKYIATGVGYAFIFR